MALQFSTLTKLQTDLASKPGIYATDGIKIVSSLEKFEVHDQVIIREYVDKDGTSRYQVATQQVLKDTSDNSWGYGTNRQWGDFDKSQTTFADEVQTRADGFEGVTLGANFNNATVIKVTVSNIDEPRKCALATAYLDDGATVTALLYKDDQDAWNTQIVN